MDPGFRLDDRYRMQRRAGRRGPAQLWLARGLPAAHEAVGVCAHVADALAAVHACGVVHGALRPGRVFLTADGVTLLAGVPVQS